MEIQKNIGKTMRLRGEDEFIKETEHLLDEELTVAAATNTIEISPGNTSGPPSPSGRSSMDSPRARRSFWEYEMLTPEQFVLPARESRAAWTGERRLLLAVLEDAIYTYGKYCHVRTRQAKRLFDEVQEWIWSRDTHWLYAFESICLYLQFDPDSIRKGLQNKHAQPASAMLPSGTSLAVTSSPLAEWFGEQEFHWTTGVLHCGLERARCLAEQPATEPSETTIGEENYGPPSRE